MTGRDLSGSSWPRPGQKVSLLLFVGRDSVESQQTVSHVRRLRKRFGADWTLDVIDVTERPELAREHRVRVVPTLIRHTPDPPQRAVGDFSDLDEVMITLRLHSR